MDHNDLLKILVALAELAVFPFTLMAYGWYLGQLHQSMQDLAGIVMFMTGILGLIIALAVSLIISRFRWSKSWRNRWFVKILEGAAGCIIVFIGIVIYARWHG